MSEDQENIEKQSKGTSSLIKNEIERYSNVFRKKLVDLGYLDKLTSDKLSIHTVLNETKIARLERLKTDFIGMVLAGRNVSFKLHGGTSLPNIPNILKGLLVQLSNQTSLSGFFDNQMVKSAIAKMNVELDYEVLSMLDLYITSTGAIINEITRDFCLLLVKERMRSYFIDGMEYSQLDSNVISSLKSINPRFPSIYFTGIFANNLEEVTSGELEKRHENVFDAPGRKGEFMLSFNFIFLNERIQNSLLETQYNSRERCYNFYIDIENLSYLDNVLTDLSHFILTKLNNYSLDIVSDERTMFVKSISFTEFEASPSVVNEINGGWRRVRENNSFFEPARWISRSEKFSDMEAIEGGDYEFQRSFMVISDSEEIESALFSCVPDDYVQVYFNQSRIVDFEDLVYYPEIVCKQQNLKSEIVKGSNVFHFTVKNKSMQEINPKFVYDPAKHRNKLGVANPYGIVYRLSIKFRRNNILDQKFAILKIG